MGHDYRPSKYPLLCSSSNLHIRFIPTRLRVFRGDAIDEQEGQDGKEEEEQEEGQADQPTIPRMNMIKVPFTQKRGLF